MINRFLLATFLAQSLLLGYSVSLLAVQAEPPTEASGLVEKREKNSFTCPICFLENDLLLEINTCKKHSACKGCVQDWIKTKIADKSLPVQCIKCNKTISDDVLTVCLNEGELLQLKRVKQDLRMEQKATPMHVSDVALTSCLNISRGKFQFCPSCRTLIEKNMGCRHMQCRKCMRKFNWCFQMNCHCGCCICGCYNCLCSTLTCCNGFLCCFHEKHEKCCLCFYQDANLNDSDQRQKPNCWLLCC